MDPKRRAALDQATAGAYAGATGFNSYTGGFPNQSHLDVPKKQRRNGKEIGEVSCCDGKFLVVFFVLGSFFWLINRKESIVKRGKTEEYLFERGEMNSKKPNPTGTGVSNHQNMYVF